jgi:hypothetical protein
MSFEEWRRAAARLRIALTLGALLAFGLSFIESALARPTGVAPVWTPAMIMKEARINHTATLLPDGRVFLAGGEGSSTPTATAELFDPQTVDFTLTKQPMGAPRSGHTATPLPDGRVLIVGVSSELLGPTAEIYDPAADSFTPTSPPLQTSRLHHTAVLMNDGRVLIAGGDQEPGVLLASAEIYDPSANTWTAAGSMITARQRHAAAKLPGGRVLVAGGIVGDGMSSTDTSSVEIFDPATNAWTAAKSMIIARAELEATPLETGEILITGGTMMLDVAELFTPDPKPGGSWKVTESAGFHRGHHTASLLPDGRVLVAGGALSGPPSIDADVYDPNGRYWSPVSPLSVPRLGHTATTLLDGRVLIAGGKSPKEVLGTAEIYSTEGDFWTPAGSMSAERDGHTATLLSDGQVLVAGGYARSFPEVSSQPTAELFDPESKAFSPASPMSEARGSHTATELLDGTILVAGGRGSLEGESLASAEMYEAGSWEAAAPMRARRADHTATRLSDGRVLVTGGQTRSGPSLDAEVLSSAEIYDPALNTWVDAGAMSSPRAEHTATLLTDGRVLVTGGLGADTQVESTAELFEPASGAFTPVSFAMRSPRRRHTATLLGDGRVLLAAGDSGAMIGPKTLTSAEIYNPLSQRFTSTDAMESPRAAHAAVRLENGAVLVAGGYEARNVIGEFTLNSVELFDPLLEQWTLVIKMSSLRQSHTATLLASGEVLAAGGLRNIPPDPLSASLRSAELLRLGALGERCGVGGACESGFCADGVCCDAACDAGLCDACSMQEGASADGACTAVITCSPYLCEAQTGVCPARCESVDQCAPGFACDLEGACVPPPPAASTKDVSGCDIGDRLDPSPTWLAALGALAIASLFARRRTRAPMRKSAGPLAG